MIRNRNGAASTTRAPAPDVPDDLITVNAACQLIPGTREGRPLHVATFYRWITAGRVRAWRVNRRWCVSRAEVLAMFEPNAVRPELETRAAQQRRQREAERQLRAAGWC